MKHSKIHLFLKIRVEDIIVESEKFTGVKISNSENVIKGRSCVLTTGTFLNGRIRLGEEIFDGGRYFRNKSGWEPPTNKISKLFQNFEIERSKNYWIKS